MLDFPGVCHYIRNDHATVQLRCALRAVHHSIPGIGNTTTVVFPTEGDGEDGLPEFWQWVNLGILCLTLPPSVARHYVLALSSLSSATPRSASFAMLELSAMF